MGNNDKHFWGSRERRKHFSGSKEHELKTFLGTRGFINGEQGIKSKNIKGSWEHVPPPPLGGAHQSLPSFSICSSLSRITDTSGERTTIEHISDFVAAFEFNSRGNSWNIKRFQNPVGSIAKTSFPRARFKRQVSCCLIKARIFGKSQRQRIEHNLFSSKSRTQIALGIVMNDNRRRRVDIICQKGRYKPISGYSRSFYTDTGSLKKCLQALFPSQTLLTFSSLDRRSSYGHTNWGPGTGYTWSDLVRHQLRFCSRSVFA